MQKEKAMIYPFDMEFCPIIRYQNLLKNYEIVEVVSPRGWGFTGKDVAFVDGGYMTGMMVKDDYSKSLEQCDTVIFSCSEYYLGMENDIYSKMKEAIQSKKNIVSLLNLEDKHKNELMELGQVNHTYVKFLGSAEEKTNKYLSRRHTLGISELKYNSNSNQYEDIHKIETPVIFVMGVTERTCKFEIQLAIREKLEKLGYKVGQIGSRSYCELLEFNSFPNFMYNNSISEVDKIIMFNRYIKEIETDQNPDILIIGIPGGIMKVSNEYTNKFGIYAYEISQAVEPDYVIMSTFYDNFEPEYYEKINLSTKHRFGYEIDCFNMANVKLDWLEARKLQNDIHIKLDSSFISKKIEQYTNAKIPVYNIFNAEHVDHIIEDIMEKLSGYAETEII